MLNPSEFIESYASIGAAKARRSALSLLLLGVLAGLLLGSAGAAATAASFAIENTSLAKLVCGLLFPFGLIMIILTGAELFTGNCLITISVLDGRAKLSGMLRNLFLVYVGNFIGSVMLAAACAYSGHMDMAGGALALQAMRTAAAKCSLSFGKALLLGILCNILVCAAVVCSLSAKSISGRVLGAYFPITLFVICGFEHSVANMYYIPAGLFARTVPKYAELAASAWLDLSALGWEPFLVNNLLPVTLGNIIGGAALAALLWVCNRAKK